LPEAEKEGGGRGHASEPEENASGRISQEVELQTRSFGIRLPRLKSFTSISGPNAQPQYLTHPNT
jgi:hypothetical protein